MPLALDASPGTGRPLATMKQGRAAKLAKHPHLEILQAKFGRSSGWALSDLFKDIQEKGIKAVKASMPHRPIRQIKRLWAAGLAV